LRDLGVDLRRMSQFVVEKYVLKIVTGFELAHYR